MNTKQEGEYPQNVTHLVQIAMAAKFFTVAINILGPQ
jgi:hypothetical protein